MKIFNWMQSKLSGSPRSNKHKGASVNHQIRQEHSKEEFSDWPHGLLAIGTFGNNNLKEEAPQSHDAQEDPSSSQELVEDFTLEEVGKLQKELTKLLSRKPVSNESESTGETGNNLPLDRFLNCPSSLEVGRTNCTEFCNDLDDDEHCYLQHNTCLVLSSKGKDVCSDSSNGNAAKKRSISFVLKKMFACRSGFAPAPTLGPSLRDPLPESTMEKLLRAVLRKKIYTQRSTSASMKKYLEDRQKVTKPQKEDDLPEKANDGSKWVNTDSEWNFWSWLMLLTHLPINYCIIIYFSVGR